MAMNKRVLAAALSAASCCASLTLVASDDPPAKASDSYTALLYEEADERSAVESPGVWLGISLKEIDGDLAEYLGSHEGVLIQNVFPDSPAEAAKLQTGDIIIAFDGEKLAGPKALIDTLLKFGKAHGAKSQEPEKAAKDQADKQEAAKEDKSTQKQHVFPSVELKILRHGKEIAVDVTPTAPPKSPKTPAVSKDDARVADLTVEIAELQDVLKDLQTQGEAKVLRFGPPLTFERRMLHVPHQHEVRNFIIIINDEDDNKKTEVRIERVGDQPPKITLKEGDKTRQISEADVERLPEKLRKTITDTLQQIEEKQGQEAAAQNAQREALRKKGMAELEKRRPGEPPRVRVVGPGGPVNLSETAEELATKFGALAEEMARRGAKNVQEFAAIPEQLEQIRTQMEELKQQMAELKAEIQKANKK